MADQYGRQAKAIAAAKILCSLRNLKPVSWPDWLPRPSTEEPAHARVPPPPLPLLWPKRPRANGRSKAADAWPLSLEKVFAHIGPRASCGGEDEPAKPKSSGDGEEECTSPAKRARVDVDGGRAAQHATPAPPEDKVEEPKKTRSDDTRDEKGCLLFDLNEDAPCEDDLDDGFC